MNSPWLKHFPGRAVPGIAFVSRLAKTLFQDRYLWLLAVPAIVYYFLFHYLPMYGLLIAFKDFSPFLGILRTQDRDRHSRECTPGREDR